MAGMEGGGGGWGGLIILYVPAWETESPASSISWSSEKAPMDMRSLSSAAAFLAEIVCESFRFNMKYFGVMGKVRIGSRTRKAAMELTSAFLVDVGLEGD